MTLRRAFWLILYVPLAAAASFFDWLADFPYARLYHENTRLRDAREKSIKEEMKHEK